MPAWQAIVWRGNGWAARAWAPTERDAEYEADVSLGDPNAPFRTWMIQQPMQDPGFRGVWQDDICSHILEAMLTPGRVSLQPIPEEI